MKNAFTTLEIVKIGNDNTEKNTNIVWGFEIHSDSRFWDIKRQRALRSSKTYNLRKTSFTFYPFKHCESWLKLFHRNYFWNIWKKTSFPTFTLLFLYKQSVIILRWFYSKLFKVERVTLKFLILLRLKLVFQPIMFSDFIGEYFRSVYLQ